MYPTNLVRRSAAIGAIAALAAISATSAQAQNRHVRIINETSHVMTHFYASNISVNNWQEDILGRSVLPAGADVNINIDDGTGHCEYDFKAVFDNGAVLIRHRVNVCKISYYRYSED